MEQGQLTRPQRRALNIIWTAAGDYSFTPAFTAFLEDGEPDLYMNAIIGYVHKWYDPAVMEPLFDQISRLLLQRDAGTAPSVGRPGELRPLRRRRPCARSSPSCGPPTPGTFSTGS